MAGALIWTLIRLSWYASREGIVQERAQAAEAPPLLVDYEFVSAPSSIPGGTTIRRIQLDYAEPEPEMLMVSFEKAAPAEYRRGRPSWCLCTVRNQGTRRLLNGLLVFESAFFEGEYAPADTVRFTQSIRVSLPSINIDEKLEFYIMNVSGLNVSLTPPETATVQLEGETHSRTARVHTSTAVMPSLPESTLTFYR